MSSHPDRPAQGTRANTDPYVWNGGATGDWGTASNWIDTTTGVAARVPPGATNAVTVNGSFYGPIDITGTGASASLTLNGPTTLGGQFTTGVLTVGLFQSLDLYAGDTLGVSENALFEGSDFIDLYGPGAALTVGATLAIGTPGGYEGARLSVYDGASVQAAALFATGDVSIALSSNSSFEVGTANDASAGSFKIDHGATATLAGTLSVPTLALNGVLNADGLTLQALSLAGTGTINIVGTLAIDGSYYGAETGGAGLSLDFTGAAGELQLGQNALDSADRLEPAIAGFTAGDQIDWAGELTGVSYANGALTLLNGSATIATLTLTGNYAGQSFVAITGAYPVEIVVVGAGDTKAAPSGTSTPDSYVWNNAVSGSWDRAANWTDSSTGADPAAVAPGAHDNVTIAESGSEFGQYGSVTVVISGKGNAAALDVNQATLFDGVFSAATLDAQAQDGALSLDAGNVLTVAGAAQFADGAALSVSGSGARFSAGALQIGSSGFGYGVQAVSLTAGAVLTAGIFQSSAYADIFIDATSSLEVGTAGTAASGSMTIDSGAIAVAAGEIDVPSLVVDGTLDAGELLLDAAAISGTGTIDIQGTLSFEIAPNWTSGPALDFATGGTLDLTPFDLDTSGHFDPVIGDFGSSNVLDWQGQPLTGVSFSGGTLSLIASTGTVATLSLSGTYLNQTFLLLPGYFGGEVVVTGAGDTKAAPAGTATPDTYVWRGGLNASWDVASNWNDYSTGGYPAAVAPGARDSVTIGTSSDGGNPLVISGKGNAAALTVDGPCLLAGSFTATSLAFDNYGSALYLDASDRLKVSGGATTAGFGSNIDVNGAGASLVIGGSYTLGTPQAYGETATIAAGNGGVIQLGGLADFVSLVLDVDQASSIEIGHAGNAAAGALTVDAGASLAMSGTIDAATLMLNGTMVANGVEINAVTLAGNGTIQIGSTLSISTVTGESLIGGAGLTVAFTGGNEVLSLSSYALDAGGLFEPTITGFGAGDVIEWNSPLTGTSFNAGTLSLLDGTSTVAELKIAGDYQGLGFIAVSNGYSSNVLSVGAGDTPTAPAGTATQDSYVLNDLYDASWDVAANWTDTSTGADPAAVAPGQNDLVTITPFEGFFSGPQVVTGTGKAASLTISDPAVLDGNFTAGTLTIDGYFGSSTLYTNASLLVTGNATLDNGFDVSAGSVFTTDGTLLINNGEGPFALAGGGYARAGGFGLAGGEISIDATSAFEVGTRGHAAAGSFYLAADTFSIAQGQITAPSIVVDGTLVAAGLTLSADRLGGTGTIAIEYTLSLYTDANATMSGGAGLDISFDPDSTLVLSPAELNAGTFLPTLTNFATDDTIIWAGDLTSAIDNHGKLTLFDGTAKVGSLTLAGNYAGDTFVTQQTDFGETYISVVANTPHIQPDVLPSAPGLMDQHASDDLNIFGAGLVGIHPY